MKSVVIVDPIFRGSRLFYSWMIAKHANDAGHRVTILARSEHKTPHFDELFGSLAATIEVREVASLPSDFWYGKVGRDNAERVVDALLSLPQKPDLIYFSGLNEWDPDLFDAMLARQLTPLAEARVVMVDYDSTFLLRTPKMPLKRRWHWFREVRKRHTAKARRFKDLKRVLPRLEIKLLDERIEDKAWRAWGRRRFGLYQALPDPAPRLVIDPASVKQQDRETTVLLVGQQSPRKGLRDVIRTARDVLGDDANIRFHISGRLEKGQEGLAPQLQSLAARIKWSNDYVSEEEIQRRYAEADYVLLPYTRDFSGSSGVLATAAALGKPVIATDHGLVGYRVQKHGMGYQYRSGDVQALGRILSNLPVRGSNEYKKLTENAYAFSREHSMLKHAKTILKDLLPSSADKPAKGGVTTSASIAGASPAPAKRHDVFVTLLDTSIASKNMGDHIIMDAVHKQLRAVLPGAFFVTAPTHDSLGEDAYKLIADSKYVFVGGTNLLSANMDSYNQWRIYERDIGRLNNVILLGVGWWQYQDKPNQYTANLYQQVLHRGISHSLRDQYTVDQLKAAGLPNVLNTSCVTMWDLTPEHCAQIPRHKGEHVVTTFTDYKPHADRDRHMYNILLRRYSKVYVWIQGARDYKYALDIVDPHRVEFIDPNLHAYDDLLRSVDSLDYMGTRLHAGVRALQHKKRSVIVAVDNRATEKAKDFNVPVLDRAKVDNLKGLVENAFETSIRLPQTAIDAWKRQFKA